MIDNRFCEDVLPTFEKTTQDPLMKIIKTYIFVLLVISVFTWLSACNRVVDREHEAVAIEQHLSKIDKTSYSKTLVWNKLTFLVQVIGGRLSIIPTGLEITNQEVSHEIDGIVSQAEIGDLNQDNFPEVLVYITSVGSGSYGSLIGYSVNDGKSMSQIYLPDLSGNAEISDGYMGHDEFAIVEDTFVQRFPIYNPEDTNAAPSGDIRQIQYKLVDGEASRRFEVDKVIEY